MAWLNHLGALALFWWIAISKAEHQCVDVAIAEKDRALSLHPIATHHTDVMSCIALCKKYSRCKSVNYFYKGGEKRRCDLLGENKFTKPTSFRHVDNRLYYGIRNVNSVTNRKSLTPKEMDESRLSSLSACYGTPCYNNGTCEETTCGENKSYKCHCLLSNTDDFCKSWIGTLSDFDLYFPRGSNEDHVTQTFKDFLKTSIIRFSSFTLSFWVNPELYWKQTTVVSLVEESTVKLKVELLRHNQQYMKVRLFLNIKGSKTFPHYPLVGVKKWTFVAIKWSNGKWGHLALRTVHADGTQGFSKHEDSGFSYEGVLSSKTTVLVGKGFRGIISRLNIWNGFWDPKPEDMTSNAKAAWPMFWDFYGPQIAGSVVKLPYSELQRDHEVFPVENTTWTAHGIDNVVMTASSLKATFNDIPCDTLAYLSVTLNYPELQKSPKRIKYKQTFSGNVKCYGIFGGLLDGPHPLNETGLYPFDPTKDKISEYYNIGAPSAQHLPYGSIYGCQEGNFWEKLGNSVAKATITQRCKQNMTNFTITTYVKCGTGSFELSDFTLLH